MLTFPRLNLIGCLSGGDQPDKILVNVKHQYTLSLPAVCTPTHRIATVAVDFAVFDLATGLPAQVTTLSIYTLSI